MLSASKVMQVTGPYEDLLTIVKRRRLKWSEHVTCSSDMTKTIEMTKITLQGTVKGKKTDLSGVGWGGTTNILRPGIHQVQRRMEETGCEVICSAPLTLGVKG